MAVWKVTPVNGDSAYEITADSYEYDETSGRHIFRIGEPDGSTPDTTIVANVLNVSVVKQPAA